MKDYKKVRSKMEGELNTLYTNLPESEHVKDMNVHTNHILDADYKKG